MVWRGVFSVVFVLLVVAGIGIGVDAALSVQDHHCFTVADKLVLDQETNPLLSVAIYDETVLSSCLSDVRSQTETVISANGHLSLFSVLDKDGSFLVRESLEQDGVAYLVKIKTGEYDVRNPEVQRKLLSLLADYGGSFDRVIGYSKQWVRVKLPVSAANNFFSEHDWLIEEQYEERLLSPQLDQSVPRIGANLLRDDLGLTGEEVTIGVIDSGFSPSTGSHMTAPASQGMFGGHAIDGTTFAYVHQQNDNAIRSYATVPLDEAFVYVTKHWFAGGSLFVRAYANGPQSTISFSAPREGGQTFSFSDRTQDPFGSFFAEIEQPAFIGRVKIDDDLLNEAYFRWEEDQVGGFTVTDVNPYYHGLVVSNYPYFLLLDLSELEVQPYDPSTGLDEPLDGVQRVGSFSVRGETYNFILYDREETLVEEINPSLFRATYEGVDTIAFDLDHDSAGIYEYQLTRGSDGTHEYCFDQSRLTGLGNYDPCFDPFSTYYFKVDEEGNDVPILGYPQLNDRYVLLFAPEQEFVSYARTSEDYLAHESTLASVLFSRDSVYTGIVPDATYFSEKTHGLSYGIDPSEGTLSLRNAIMDVTDPVSVYVTTRSSVPESYFIESIHDLASQGAHIVLLSSNTDPAGAEYPELYCDEFPLAETMHSYALHANMLFVVPAGNIPFFMMNPELDAILYPGCASSALTVGGASRGSTVLELSGHAPNFNPLKPEIVAPGGDVPLSSVVDEIYYDNGNALSLFFPMTASSYLGLVDPVQLGSARRSTGTSLAAAHAAGVAAQLMQANPNLCWYEYRAILQETATDLGAPTYRQGSGLLNASAAYARLVDPNAYFDYCFDEELFCDDGTTLNSCSVDNDPYFCAFTPEDGVALVASCQRCGCPQGYACVEENELVGYCECVGSHCEQEFIW
ncbi:MAG: S8 family serine peptidase [Candidatus Woesearchaeota archaeon]|nr:MAG: S8 family serine peptidase [Candidatus Woesearchaeota archaeon]